MSSFSTGSQDVIFKQSELFIRVLKDFFMPGCEVVQVQFLEDEGKRLDSPRPMSTFLEDMMDADHSDMQVVVDQGK